MRRLLLWAPKAPSCWGPSEDPRWILANTVPQANGETGLFVCYPSSSLLRATCRESQPSALPVCTAPKLNISHSAWKNIRTQRERSPHRGGNQLSVTAAGEARGRHREVGRIYLQHPFLYLICRSPMYFLNMSMSVFTTLSSPIHRLSVHFIISGIFNTIAINSISCLLYGFHSLFGILRNLSPFWCHKKCSTLSSNRYIAFLFIFDFSLPKSFFVVVYRTRYRPHLSFPHVASQFSRDNEE